MLLFPFEGGKNNRNSEIFIQSVIIEMNEHMMEKSMKTAVKYLQKYISNWKVGKYVFGIFTAIQWCQNGWSHSSLREVGKGKQIGNF